MDAHLHQPGDNLAEIRDEDLLSLIDAGTSGAFAELYRRHRDQVLTVASDTLGAGVARTVVDDSFLTVLKTLLLDETLTSGAERGPDFSTRLMQALREEISGRQAAPTGQVGAAHAEAAALDPILTAAALSALPDNWQRILWLREVERLSPRAVAAHLDITPTAVTQLGVRARRGLQEAWLALQPSPAASECRSAGSRLAEYAIGRMSPPRRRSVRDHLENCTDCSAIVAQINEFSIRCRSVLVPALLISPVVIERLADTVSAAPVGAAAAPAITTEAPTVTVEQPAAPQPTSSRRKRVLPKPVLIPAAAAAIVLAATLLGFSFASPETEDTSYHTGDDSPSAPAEPDPSDSAPGEKQPAPVIPNDEPDQTVGTDKDVQKPESDEAKAEGSSPEPRNRDDEPSHTPASQDSGREEERGGLQEGPWIGPGPSEDAPEGRSPSTPPPAESPEPPADSPDTEEPGTSPAAEPEPAPDPGTSEPAPDAPPVDGTPPGSSGQSVVSSPA